jgi:putative FmdB family regulatory protein
MTDDVHNPAVNWYSFDNRDELVRRRMRFAGCRWSMPTYEYMCKKCGPFTQLRPMAECELPSTCPKCRARSPRVMLTAPGCLTMSPEERQQGVKYERIIERYDGHEPPPYVRPPRSSKKAPRAKPRTSRPA